MTQVTALLTKLPRDISNAAVGHLYNSKLSTLKFTTQTVGTNSNSLLVTNNIRSVSQTPFIVNGTADTFSHRTRVFSAAVN